MKERILGIISGLFYRLYTLTFRYKIHFQDDSAKIGYEGLKSKSTNNNVIAAVWHQDEIAALAHFKDSNTCIMVSDSTDGTIFSHALHTLGFETVRGSSTRGGVKAFVGAIRKLKNGSSMAIAIDGPRGPLYEVKQGVLKLSEKSNRPVLPIRLNPRNCFTFEKAWSKSRLPYPFSVIDVYVKKCHLNYDEKSLKKILS